MKIRNVALGTLVATLGLVLANMATAGTVISTTVTGWKNSAGGNVTLDDKTFHYVSSHGFIGASATDVGIGATAASFNDLVPNVDVLSLGTIPRGFQRTTGAFLAGPWHGSLDYTVTINSGPNVFTDVAMSSTVVGRTGHIDVQVQKTITGTGFPSLTLTNINNGPAVDAPVAGTTLAIHETFTVTANGLLESTANTFQQANPAPEMDGNFVATALTLLLGCMAVLLGRKKVVSTAV